jgi:hypothetical protein
MTLTLPEFVEALEHELQFRGMPFTRAELLAFVVSAWTLIEDDPDVGRWAWEFLEAMGLAIV